MQHRYYQLKLTITLIICFILLSSIYMPVPAKAQTPPHAGDIPLDLKDISDYTNVVYIDPSTTMPGDGSSPSTPLSSWADVSFQTDTAYVQKRGTTDTVFDSITIWPGSENVLLGAYGSTNDPRPIIYGDLERHVIDINTPQTTVRDLEIVSPRALSGIRFGPWQAPPDGVVWNCSVHGVDQNNYLMWGIRIFGPRTKILNTEIYYTGDDGIFTQDAPMIEIGYNHITRVNQKWFEDPSESYSGGDGVQYDGDINGFYIHHNTVDRTDTGNKFCFIANTDTPSGDVFGLIEYNTCSVTNSIPVYANPYNGSPNYRLIIRNNIFKYEDTDGQGIGVYNHATSPEIYNNVFIGFRQAVVFLSPTAQAKLHHNVFYDIGYAAVGSTLPIEAHNNIFSLDTGANAFSSMTNVTASHNLFSNAAQAIGSNPIIGDPQFIDPANDNFRLQGQSPAIDAGITGTGVISDADGNTRDNRPDIGAYEFKPAVKLYGSPADGGINLTWTVNTTIPVTSTWRINYVPVAGGTTVVATDTLTSTTRAYPLTGLTNGTWYTVTLEALLNSIPFLTDTIRALATDQQVYLPVVLK